MSFLGCTYELDAASARSLAAVGGPAVTVGFRPEEIRLAPERGGRLPSTECIVELVEPLGSETNVLARTGEHVFVCKVPARSGLSVGDKISVEFEPTQMKLFDADSGQCLELEAPTTVQSGRDKDVMVAGDVVGS